MGHIVQVAGTGRPLTGGRVLVGGVGYGIVKGRTLVDGVGYDIAFAKTCRVTLMGTWKKPSSLVGGSDCYVIIHGRQYATATTVEVIEGTEIQCHVSSDAGNGNVYVDGKDMGGRYTHIVTEDVTLYGYANYGVISINQEMEFCDLHITGTMNSTYCYVTVNGTKITSAQTLTSFIGAQLHCYAARKLNMSLSPGAITLNGAQVNGDNLYYEMALGGTTEVACNYISPMITPTIAITAKDKD